MFPIPIISNTSIAPPPSGEYERFLNEISSTNRVFMNPGSDGINPSLGKNSYNNSSPGIDATNAYVGTWYGYNILYSQFNTSDTCTAFKQAFPDLEVWQDHLDNERTFAYTITPEAYNSGTVPETTRNGVLSGADGMFNHTGIHLSHLIYYDFRNDRMMIYNPCAGQRSPDKFVMYYHPSSSEDYEYWRYWHEKYPKGYPSDTTYIRSHRTYLNDANWQKSFTFVSSFVHEQIFANFYQGGMTGTPVGSYMHPNSVWHKIIQHCLPPDVFENYKLSHYSCWADLEYVPSVTAVPLLSKTINGYTSAAQSSYSGKGFKITKFVYYDASTKKMMQYNPFEMSVPVAVYP